VQRWKEKGKEEEVICRECGEEMSYMGSQVKESGLVRDRFYCRVCKHYEQTEWYRVEETLSRLKKEDE
jgi:hypothetical protein